MASLAVPLIGAGASLISGWLGGNKAKKAAEHLERVANASGKAVQDTTLAGAQQVSDATMGGQGHIDAAKNQSNQALEGVYNEEKGNLNPYLATGQQGLDYLSAAFKPGGSLAGTFKAPTAEEAAATPGYEFQRNEGTKAVQRSAAAAGGLGSGGTMKALDQYSQGLASTYYQNAYNNALQAYQTNHQNTLQGYMALTGVGQNATNQFNSAAQNYGNLTSANTLNAGQAYANMGLQGSEFNAGFGLQGSKIANDYYMQGAGASAAGTMGAANSWQNALNGVAGAAGSYFSQQPTGMQGPGNISQGYTPGPGQYNPATYAPGYSPTMTPPPLGPNPYAYRA